MLRSTTVLQNGPQYGEIGYVLIEGTTKMLAERNIGRSDFRVSDLPDNLVGGLTPPCKVLWQIKIESLSWVSVTLCWLIPLIAPIFMLIDRFNVLNCVNKYRYVRMCNQDVEQGLLRTRGIIANTFLCKRLLIGSSHVINNCNFSWIRESLSRIPTSRIGTHACVLNECDNRLFLF